MEADRPSPQPSSAGPTSQYVPVAAAHDHMAGDEPPAAAIAIATDTDDRTQQPPPQPPAPPTPLPSSAATVLRKIQKWWDYRSYGDVIAGSRVIPMKTPMTSALQARPARLEATARARSGSVDGSGGVAPGQEPAGEQREHTIGGFIREQAAQGRAVGLIVDLSNHDSLYADDMPKCPGVAYQHFHFVAKEVPDRAGCQRVARAITAYLAQHPEHYVGIHCSYGFNRTGLVCCAYLCEELGFSVDQALAAFAAARPPGVKHQHFIEALRVRYGPPAEVSPATTLASACSSGGSPMALLRTGKKEGGDDDDGSAAVAAAVAATAAAGIIPPAESEPPQAPALGEEGDVSTSGVRLGNNETLGGDVREAILAALQLHQQEQAQEQEQGSDVESQRQPSSLRSCGGVGCVVS